MMAVWKDTTSAELMADKMDALLVAVKDCIWAVVKDASMVDLTA